MVEAGARLVGLRVGYSQKGVEFVRPKMVLVVQEDKVKGIEVGFDTGEVETGQGRHSNMMTEL